MSFDVSTINLWDALVAAGASFLIGGLWYGVLFGKTWARVYRLSEDDLRSIGAHPERTFPIMLACDVVAALVVALLATNLEIRSAVMGAALGLALWIGVAGALSLATHVGSGRPMFGWVIDSGKQLASLVTIGAIVGGWR